MSGRAVRTNSARAWVLAARPKTLTGAAVPVMLGCALAWSGGRFSAAFRATGAAADALSVTQTTATNLLAATQTVTTDTLAVIRTATADVLAATQPVTANALAAADLLSATQITAIDGVAVAQTAAVLSDVSLFTAFILPAALCLLFAFLMQIDANFINDLWDFRKGSDREDRLGPERACAQGWITPPVMKRGIVLTTVAAAVTGCGLLFYGGWVLIPVGLACLLFAFLYTAGPYPLAYHGWGDVLVLVFFGFVPVGCTYYVLCRSWNWEVAAVSAACGLVIDTLLMVNNYRDRDQDVRSGKRTLVVRWGAVAGEWMYLLPGLIAVGLCLSLLSSGRIWAALLPLVYLVPHVVTWRRMVRIGRGRELNEVLGETSRNILLFGLLLTLGLLVG